MALLKDMAAIAGSSFAYGLRPGPVIPAADIFGKPPPPGSGGSRPPGIVCVTDWLGEPAGAFRSGGCCVSHGMFGRKTGRRAGRAGRVPIGGPGAVATEPSPRPVVLRIAVVPPPSRAREVGG